MEIRKLFGQNEAVKTAAQKKPEEIEQSQVQGQAQAQVPHVAGQDVVTVSSLSKQLLQVSDILTDEEKKRAARVEELKRAVKDGSYSASSTEVARSIISFASELQPQAEA